MKRQSPSRGGAAKRPKREPAKVKRSGSGKSASARSSAGQAAAVQLRRELAEALDRQTATAEILDIIARSPGDAQPVFETIARSAARLCKAQFCYVFRFDGALIHFAAQYGYARTPENFLAGYPLPPGRTSAATRSVLTGAIEHIPDVTADPDYAHRAHAKDLQYRSIVAVPMLKDGRPLGTIAMARSEPGKFPAWQIDLLQTFAAQAVIAIENARLLSELRESLQQQTAMADVLSVISGSPGELDPVFDAIMKKAVTLCDATLGNLFLYDGTDFVSAAVHTVSPTYAEARRRGLVVRHLHPEVPLNRITRTKELIHIADVRTAEAYIDRDPVFCELV